MPEVIPIADASTVASTFIQQLGFPIAVCSILGYFLYIRYKDSRVDCEKHEASMTATINEVYESNKQLAITSQALADANKELLAANRELLAANKELMNANKLLMDDYKGYLQDISKDVIEIKTMMK